MTKFGRRRLGGLLVGAGAVVAWPTRALASVASAAQAAAVLARALSYEQTLSRRAGKRVDIALVHDGSGASRTVAQEWFLAFRSLSGIRVDGKPLDVQVVGVDDELPALFSSGGVDVVVACGEVSAACVQTISTLTRSTRSLSVATRRAQVQAALTLGIVREGSKIKILVNLRAAERERVRFSAKLLKLAEILR